MSLLSEAFIIGACAWVATGVLFQPDHILERYWNGLDSLYKRGGLWKWVAKAFGYCGYCFAGQLGFWTFFFSHHLFHLFVTCLSLVCHLFELFQFALLTIFFWSACNGVDNLYKKYNG